MASKTVSTPKFGEVSQRLANAGISDEWHLPVIPPGAELKSVFTLDKKAFGKTPGRYDTEQRAWGGLGGGLITNGVPEREANSFKDWPTGNLGLMGMAYPAIDSDAETGVAAELIERAMTRAFGKGYAAAERIRGKNHRKLFAFEADAPNSKTAVVRTRHITYQPKGDKVQSKLDVIGIGNHYVVAGQHPSGDAYGWDPKADLFDGEYQIDRITNADIDRFIAEFTELLAAQGGELVSSTGSSGNGSEKDVSKLAPAMSIADVLTGLAALPNTEANYRHRDDLVGVLAAVRAALGSEAEGHRDVIMAWATESSFDPDWCSEDYFDKCWNSLGTVRVGQDTLERLFRRNGLNHATGAHFPEGDAVEVKAIIEKAKKQDNKIRTGLLVDVAEEMAFRDANRLDGLDGCMVRDRGNVDAEIPALVWWKQEAILSDGTLLASLQSQDRYPANKVGLANFLRDIRREHPECFFLKEIRDPKTRPGDIVTRDMNGSKRNYLNVRRLSPAQILGSRKSMDPARDARDVASLLVLIEGMFGKHVDYELDTLAYMAQTCERPGNMLFLVGDKGVGKSMYIEMLINLFDGDNYGAGIIDGTKMANEGSRRFAYSTIEGCRIVSHRELPKDMPKRTMSEITAGFKTLVDRGIGGKYIMTEGKGTKVQPIENVCRVVVSSNYSESLEIEENDRRIFYIESGITLSNKLSDAEYAEFDAITSNPHRLAAFWRFLLNRDVADYKPHRAPPMTTEKNRQQIIAASSPERRHLSAALLLLEASNRKLVTFGELCRLMTEMSENEKQNTAGQFDDVKDYTKASMNSPEMRHVALAIRTATRERLLKVNREFRDPQNHRRVSPYVLAAGLKEGFHKMMEKEGTGWVLNELDEDRRRHGLVEHPVEEYRSNGRED